MADRDDRKKRRGRKRDTATDVGEGVTDAVLDGCGCDFFILAFLAVAGVPLLLWSL